MPICSSFCFLYLSQSGLCLHLLVASCVCILWMMRSFAFPTCSACAIFVALGCYYRRGHYLWFLSGLRRFYYHEGFSGKPCPLRASWFVRLCGLLYPAYSFLICRRRCGRFWYLKVYNPWASLMLRRAKSTPTCACQYQTISQALLPLENGP